MFVSLKWLQTYFEQKLPEAERIADLLNFHAFEVEDIRNYESSNELQSHSNGESKDEILDIKILADRTNYALCHRGIAGEISAAGNIKLTGNPVIPAKAGIQARKVGEEINKKPEIEIKKPALCSRYIGRRVENIKIKESPDWLKERLESIGERSISNVVDAANFVMFDMGQPLHAFDADKVKGMIEVRPAKKGEKMTTLDNRDVELDPSVLIIADQEGPLAIAGIKGGKRAEVDEKTENLILEAANFNASSIRLSSTRLDIKTGAARRFEANMAPIYAEEGMAAFSALIKDLVPSAKFGPVNDIYPKKQKMVSIETTPDFIRQVLGIAIKDDEIISSLSRLGISAAIKKDKLIIVPPLNRTDLNIPEDIAEEVGRIYGYENLKSVLPPAVRGKAMVNKHFYYTEKIKNILVENGFSEVILYTLAPKGHFETEKPLALERKYLRTNLAEGLAESLKRNAGQAPLLGLQEIRIFEIGKVFGPGGEKEHLAIGRQTLIKKDRRNEDILNEIVGMLGTAFEMPLSAKVSSSSEGAIAELDITDLFRTARSPDSYSELHFGRISDNKYQPFSQYPFVLRDIAVFTPAGTDKKEPLSVISKEAGEWHQRTELFDTFEKKMPDGSAKISYAFHLVFQSDKKTLTDAEVNEVMDRISKAMNARPGWQVR